jgi:HD superfamily phosphodiesterase
MNKHTLVQEAEKFMREHIPTTRITSEGSNESYLRHVLGARKYALQLAEKYKADGFIVAMAALLHDVGADTGKEHPLESARIARDFLSGFDLDAAIKERIIRCIERHSTGSVVESMEEQIIQDADGIIFIEDTYRFSFEKYKRKLPLDQAKRKIMDKVKAKWDKIKTEEGKRIAGTFFPKCVKYLESAS